MKDVANPIQTWIGVSTSSRIKNPIPFKDEKLQLVHDQADMIHAYIKSQFYKYGHLIEVVLTLRHSNTDERLNRFLDEPGLIAPEYGKKFLGLYFQKIKIEMYPLNEMKGFIETIKKQFDALIVKYFIENPSAYSNWEFSLRNPKPVKTYKGIQTAVIVNFPLIEFEAF
jgi:hypothetical protein